MPKGTPLYKLITKEDLISLYKKNGSIEGIRRETGYDTKSVRKLLDRYEIPFKYKTIYNHNDFAFKNDNEGSYYWAGFIAADGCIKEKNKNTKILSVSLANKDKSHLYKLKEFLEAEEPVKEYEKYSSLQIVSNTIAEDLYRFNILPRKTKTYTFPDKLKNNNIIHHFMRGYFDGDGCLHKVKNKYIYFSVRGTYKFLDKYTDILVSEANIKKNKIGLSSGIYQFSYGGLKNCNNILSFLYNGSTIFLDRKYEKAKLYF